MTQRPKALSQKMFPVEDYKFDLSEPLEKTYKLVGFIGAGVDGTVLHIKNRSTGLDLALKMVPNCTPILIEVERHVASFSNLFARCYGMIVATKLPQEWSEILQRKSWPFVSFGKNIFYGYFYEYSGVNLNEWIKDKKHQTPRLVAAVIFEVFYGILWAGKVAQFVHKDLHAGNVLMKPYKTEGRRYKIADKMFVIDTPSIVQIIDFDKSSLGVTTPVKKMIDLLHGFEYNMVARDMSHFIWSFGNAIGSVLSKKKKETDLLFNDIKKHLEKQNTYKGIEQVFNLDYFVQFVAPSFEMESDTKRTKIECHICGDQATRKLENRPSLAFCANDRCVLKLGNIAHMI